MDFSAILQYKMDDIESRAYKCALIWEKCCKALFPKEKYARLRQKGDPRKSYLFKCCYTLVNERRTVIPSEDFKLYIFAQLDMLRKISDGNQHADIDPICLFGDKAWYRWKIWKRNYDVQRTFKAKTVCPHKENVVRELDRTKGYLTEVFGHEPSLDEIQVAYDSKAMLRWFRLGKISPYFLILFPPLSEVNGWGIDLNLYREHIQGNEEELKGLFNK